MIARAGAFCLVITLGAQVSSPSDAEREFRRGVIALHNFEYEEANSAFLTAQKRAPNFAMAYWGEAMTYHQTLWGNEDIAMGRRILLRLAPTPAARAAKAATAKEQGLLGAIEILFGDGDSTARRAAYAKAMETMHAQMPDDADIAAFYALALLGTMPRGIGEARDAQEGHSHALAGSAVQSRVTAILERVLRTHPDHPGALHYLLHNNDDPEHARIALDAARRYAQVAPQSSHALHMPAHIFLQLGLWRDAALSDRAAFAASDAWVKAKGLSPAMRNYHALSWLQYEWLQRGQYRAAAGTLGELSGVVKATRQATLLTDLASMRARYVIETRRWDILANEKNFANVNELFAIGVSAARSGNAAFAETARQELAARSQSEQNADLRPVVGIMERELAAMIALAQKRGEQAIELLRAASDAERQLPPPIGPAIPIKPASELLGEVLLELARPREALAAFRQALQRNANRTLSVLGMARAAKAAGDTTAAREHYRALLESYDEADADVPALDEARAGVGR